ncbi:MAG: glycosyltransferase family 4 protein, partial [Bacteroidaceae bacterium]|nr:glycosyltransferase family 4 protein [Bacteroidaceae bacterium]
HNRKSTYVIFQNEDDRQLFLEHKVVRSEQAYFIKGSGVDLKDFIYTSEPDSEKLNVIFTARMVKEKGVLTLVEAAELLRKDYEDKVEFWLCGGLSNNPRAIGQEKLQALCDGKYIQWLGYRTDVRELLMKSHIVAFPSYYREGLPKSLIEASAVGRPIITTDSVGCRDVVEDGVNGFIIPIKDAIALADKLRTLLDNRALRISMGRKSREFAVRDFSIDEVIGTHLEIYSMVYGAIQCRK